MTTGDIAKLQSKHDLCRGKEAIHLCAFFSYPVYQPVIKRPVEGVSFRIL